MMEATLVPTTQNDAAGAVATLADPLMSHPLLDERETFLEMCQVSLGRGFAEPMYCWG